MADRVSPEIRSRIMASVKSRGTNPEIQVRRLLHKMGYRYRLHRANLPGCPDLVFPSRRKVIFVHGCFWHSHPGCNRSTMPATNREFWITKIKKNQARDIKNEALLEATGWSVKTVWQCQLKDMGSIACQLETFLGGATNSSRTSRLQ